MGTHLMPIHDEVAERFSAQKEQEIRYQVRVQEYRKLGYTVGSPSAMGRSRSRSPPRGGIAPVSRSPAEEKHSIHT
jgi:hypothetical protein